MEQKLSIIILGTLAIFLGLIAFELSSIFLVQHNPDNNSSLPPNIKNDLESSTQDEDVYFILNIDNIEECGYRCREVRTTLINNGTKQATSVKVNVKIYTGNELIWKDNKSIGTLKPNSPKIDTQQINVGIDDALKIQENNGWITIITNISSNQTNQQSITKEKII